MSTGTIGLLAVGLLIVAVTPRRAEPPIAISASTTPVALAEVARPGGRIASSEVLAVGGSVTAGAGSNGTTTVRRPVGLAPVPSAQIAGPTPPAATTAAMSLVTPLGDGRFGIVTRASLAGGGDVVIDVRLPSGRTTVGEIITASDDAVVVALAAVEPGHDIATARPRHDDVVTVMADPPVDVAYAEIDELDIEVHEGTAIVDRRGELVGICTRGDRTDSVEVIEVVAALDDATTAAP